MPYANHRLTCNILNAYSICSNRNAKYLQFTTLFSECEECMYLTHWNGSLIQITNYLRQPREKVKENIFMLLFIQLLSACVLYTINHCRHTFLGKL
jgi:hypothetical protein